VLKVNKRNPCTKITNDGFHGNVGLFRNESGGDSVLQTTLIWTDMCYMTPGKEKKFKISFTNPLIHKYQKLLLFHSGNFFKKILTGTEQTKLVSIFHH
jgi:hypothetical protein